MYTEGRGGVPYLTLGIVGIVAGSSILVFVARTQSNVLTNIAVKQQIISIMFRQIVLRLNPVCRSVLQAQYLNRPAVASVRLFSSKVQETDEQFDARWEAYFNRPEIDDWELRRGLNELHGHDLVPEPKILIAAFKACRRLNDTAMAIRILEAVKDKSRGHKNIYPYILQEVRPTLDELGIQTPEELGLDQPQQDKIY